MQGVIGYSVLRIDAVSKATGQALYASDYSFPGMLHVKLVRSTEAHALINKIDTDALQGVPGVYCFTARDLVKNSHGNILKDQPVLAWDKVRFYGEPVAVIAADSPEKAEEYAKMVKAEYKPLGIVAGPEEAMLAESPKIHDGGNVLQHISFAKGNVQEALEQSHLVLEDTFTLPVVDHLYLETEAGVSFLDENGVLNIIAGTQNPFYDREEICRCLGIPPEKVRVKTANTGGGFGGKDGNTVQLFLALVTWKTGRPARLVFTREESLVASYKRHAAKIKVKIGFTPAGEITAYQAGIYFDTGAYAALGPAVLGLGVEHAAGPYIIPNVELNGYLCYTNKPPASAMRGFGAPQTAFATETLLNKAAKMLKIDPVDLRLKNALVKGAEGSLGQPMGHAVGLKEALQILKDSPLWQERSTNKDPHIGYGMAAGYLSCGMGKGIPDQARVEIEELPGPNYQVKIGTVEIGQGSNTLFAQLAAEALGVPLSQITVIMGDTGLTHDCGSTAASRTGYICGNALLAAVQDLKKQKAAGVENPKGIGEAVFPEVEKPDLGIGLPHSMYTFIAQAVKAKVDPLSGEVRLLDIFAVTEAGRVVNPMSLDGQIHGGIAMGAGYCLTEEIKFTRGLPRENNLSTYLIPTSLDLPNISNRTVDSYEESGPQGLKGAAEVAAVAIAPAITAAINDVIPVPLNELPVSRQKIAEFVSSNKQ
ncbi:xanthine dehydrogenase family protein molybdopterin-binding subunit [Zhaonella formicivorans]|uniref:xanthine dehydrogenase family protein molybdopterin-binding subunit n=1 Tax=Zhaonella formicivorans TaxID=2528593 RepID=UPI001D1138FC|nr:xanthine dehydrogenase family protein molybdopterin-binding subunit [Zhaonella formicivorans]